MSFQVPFHLLEQLLCSLTGQPENARLWGRIASVFYFSLGCVLGALVLYRYFGKKPGMVALYAVIMTFSLFHIEQSRYGTGDAISFFLLTAAVFASALFLEKDKKWFLFLSGFAVGALGRRQIPAVVLSSLSRGGAGALQTCPECAPPAYALPGGRVVCRNRNRLSVVFSLRAGQPGLYSGSHIPRALLLYGFRATAPKSGRRWSISSRCLFISSFIPTFRFRCP